MSSPPALPQPARIAPGHAAADQVGYAVIDLETTGLSPRTESIVEIALVLTDARGVETSSWSTLVDPGRSVGPTHIHGIRAGDVAGAPKLMDVADRLARDLAGRVLVAHNARFDLSFLVAALTSTGHCARGVSATQVPSVCTMEWSRHFMTTPSRRLTTCCEVAGIKIGRHHSALDDARASAALLAHYVRLSQGMVPWGEVLEAAHAGGVTGPWTWDARKAANAVLVPRGRRDRGRPDDATSGRTDGDTADAVGRFTQAARAAWHDSTLSEQDWNVLVERAASLDIPADEAAQIVRRVRP